MGPYSEMLSDRYIRMPDKGPCQGPMVLILKSYQVRGPRDACHMH